MASSFKFTLWPSFFFRNVGIHNMKQSSVVLSENYSYQIKPRQYIHSWEMFSTSHKSLWNLMHYGSWVIQGSHFRWRKIFNSHFCIQLISMDILNQVIEMSDHYLTKGSGCDRLHFNSAFIAEKKYNIRLRKVITNL